MKIAVFGAGAWGTALAVNACARQPVALWAREAAQAEALRAHRENRKYLPGIALPGSLDIVEGDPAAVAAACDLAVIATPMAGLRDMLARLANVEVPVVWLCKGFEPAGADGGKRENGRVCKGSTRAILRRALPSGSARTE